MKNFSVPGILVSLWLWVVAAVIENHVFTQNQNWISTTPVATDPAQVVNTRLVDWMAAMGGQGGGVGQCGLSIMKAPADNTTKASATDVAWLIRDHKMDNTNVHLLSTILTQTGVTGNSAFTGSYGFEFATRNGNAAAANFSRGPFYNWSDSTSNNGRGTYSTWGPVSTQFGDLTGVSPTFTTAYEAVGSTPWFAVYQVVGTTTGFAQVLFKSDYSGVDFSQTYTADRWRPDWHYMHIYNSLHNLWSPQWSLSGTGKYAGFSADGLISSVFQVPTSTNQYFWVPRHLVGTRAYCGKIPQDLFALSTAATGTYGDTTTIEGNTYKKVGTQFWLRSI